MVCQLEYRQTFWVCGNRREGRERTIPYNLMNYWRGYIWGLVRCPAPSFGRTPTQHQHQPAGAALVWSLSWSRPGYRPLAPGFGLCPWLWRWMQLRRWRGPGYGEHSEPGGNSSSGYSSSFTSTSSPSMVRSRIPFGSRKKSRTRISTFVPI